MSLFFRYLLLGILLKQRFLVAMADNQTVSTVHRTTQCSFHLLSFPILLIITLFSLHVSNFTPGRVWSLTIVLSHYRVNITWSTIFYILFCMILGALKTTGVISFHTLHLVDLDLLIFASEQILCHVFIIINTLHLISFHIYT